VDIYGNCGMGCARNSSCFEELGKKYKFYMALENSLCVDYITEKSSNGWAYGMVPIIYGLGKKEMFAPPTSYIDALEFETVERLAAYLQFLDKHPEEYFKYFEWRSMYNLKYSFVATYHCHIWKKMKKVTQELTSGKHEGHMSLYMDVNHWHFHFYNNALKRYCRNCLLKSEIDIINLKRNKLRIYNNTKQCEKH